MPLKAKKYLALPIQSMLGCLKNSIMPLLLPFLRLQTVAECSQAPIKRLLKVAECRAKMNPLPTQFAFEKGRHSPQQF